MPDINSAIHRLLTELADSRMPFGKFGPEKFPPRGLLIYELPYEYLRFFERKGYPAGKLGKHMKFVHDIKRDGAEEIFAELKKQNGAVSLRTKKRITHMRFSDDE
ncbi:MAG: DUF3820 family protein [Lentisphaeria bacterium]|nr:DUF3820 family protein [Lentisphaeria bacterium]